MLKFQFSIFHEFKLKNANDNCLLKKVYRNWHKNTGHFEDYADYILKLREALKNV
jgi:hypothetical protein